MDISKEYTINISDVIFLDLNVIIKKEKINRYNKEILLKKNNNILFLKLFFLNIFEIRP